MGKKVRVVDLPIVEIRVILRAADELIGEGGRTLLSKVLKGSKERKLLELGLDRIPSYGYYRELTLEQIVDKIDHLIQMGYIETESNGLFPVLKFTPFGWVIERERRAEEFLREWDSWLDNNTLPISMEYLKDRNRGMILLFLFKILNSRNPKYIPLLALWESVDYRKVQAAIRDVIQALEQGDQMDEAQWQQVLEEQSQVLIVRSKRGLVLACQTCDCLIIFDEMDLSHYSSEGFEFPKICEHCVK